MRLSITPARYLFIYRMISRNNIRWYGDLANFLSVYIIRIFNVLDLMIKN